eukprot:SAG11_NODE_778_length_7212_cov_4.265392_2_plen_272_part_00
MSEEDSKNGLDFTEWQSAGIASRLDGRPYHPNDTYTISDIFAIMPREHARVFMQPLLLRDQVTLESIQGTKISAMSCNAVGADAGAGDCGIFDEDTPLDVECPEGTAVAYVNYASWGRTQVEDQTFVKGACHSDHSWSHVSSKCLGQQKCRVMASNQHFGDPCPRKMKSLAVQVTCTDESTATRAQTNFNLFQESTQDLCACSHSRTSDGAPISGCAKDWENGYLLCECLPKTALVSHGIPFKLFPFMAKIRRTFDFCKKNTNWNVFNTIC